MIKALLALVASRSVPRRIATGVLLALAVAGLLAKVEVAAQQLQAGANVNMVGGPASITLNPFKILGDPYGQRQNEPSMDCGSRNPLTCVAGSNDYRMVDVPGAPDTQVTGDAWLGFFWTRDGGGTWRSTVLPGAPQDNSVEGLVSPIHGFEASADPTVRAGTNGLFFYSGIAFNRSANVFGNAAELASAPGDGDRASAEARNDTGQNRDRNHRGQSQ